MKSVYTDTSPELLEMVTLEDIPQKVRPVAVMVGVETFIKLCEYASGDELYFPVRKTLCRRVRRRLIRNQYNGSNANELAKKYGLTVSSVQFIVKTTNRE